MLLSARSTSNQASPASSAPEQRQVTVEFPPMVTRFSSYHYPRCQYVTTLIHLHRTRTQNKERISSHSSVQTHSTVIGSISNSIQQAHQKVHIPTHTHTVEKFHNLDPPAPFKNTSRGYQATLNLHKSTPPSMV